MRQLIRDPFSACRPWPGYPPLCRSLGRRRRLPERLSAHRRSCQLLGDLDRIQRGALQQLVAGDEQRERMSGRIGKILANAADEDIVDARGFNGHREMVLLPVVDDFETRGLGQDVPRLIRRQFLIQLHRDGHRVRTEHRHSDAGHADAQLRHRHDLPQLGDDLGFLAIVAVRSDRRIVAEQVERIGMRQHAWLEALAIEIGAGGILELLHRGRPGAGRRLIRRGDDALHPAGLVQRPQRHHHDRRDAIGVGDDPGLRGDQAAIHFRHDQRIVRIHPEGRGIVDHDRASARRNRSVLLGNVGFRSEQGDIHAFERIFRQRGDRDFIVTELHRTSGRALRREDAELANIDAGLLKAPDHLSADRARGANDCDCLAHREGLLS